MYPRQLLPILKERLKDNPVVALLGPRQIGKTTLAHALQQGISSQYLDLELESDLIKLSDPEWYFSLHEDSCVILDEIQRKPELFKVLRSRVDQMRQNKKKGRFLILGSASLELLRQSSESLAGRISFLELAALNVQEVGAENSNSLWLRGGFPHSLDSRTDNSSFTWRRDFIRTYLERDIPQFGSRIPAETLRRFWTMLAHRHGGLHNAAPLAQSLGVHGKTVASYLDLFVDLFLVRRLQPWHQNNGKRLIKSPKVYLRDTGLLHALLGLKTLEELLGHPTVGTSWEGFVIENILSILPERIAASFYRTSAGAEIDLVLEISSQDRYAIEIKRSLAPSPSKGFYLGSEDIRATQRWVIYPGQESFPLNENTQVTSLPDFMKKIAQITT
ncbi:MAG: ATP-binding protein [Blastochloris sp.]|nr:ATP-binding protein [Blastochloris sp.]